MLSFVRFSTSTSSSLRRRDLSLSPSVALSLSLSDYRRFVSHVVRLPCHRPTDLAVREVESSRETETLKTEARGARARVRPLCFRSLFSFPLTILSLSLRLAPSVCPTALSLLFTTIFPFEGRRVQLPSRSCYHYD